MTSRDNVAIGIDPGPKGFAWAVFGSPQEDIIDWGQCAVDLNGNATEMIAFEADLPTWCPTVVAIEKPMLPYEGVAKGQKFTTQPALDTAQVVGLIRFLLRRAYRVPVILVPRPTVKAALPGCTANSKKAQVNAVMKKLCPALDRKAKGLNDHVRDAAALAYVALGQWKEMRLTQCCQ